MASTLTVDKIKGGSSGVALTLPTTDGSAGQLLKTDGSAVLSWATDTDTTYTASGVVSIDGSNVITSTGEANAANTAITSSAQSFTEDQTFEAITETVTAKSAGFTPDLSNDGTVYNVTGAVAVTMPTAESGKSFTIIASAPVSSWTGTIKWASATVPTGTGICIYTFVSDGTNWYAFEAGNAFG
mgnify:CR=1 FL=1|jgi:hypothetical protein